MKRNIYSQETVNYSVNNRKTQLSRVVVIGKQLKKLFLALAVMLFVLGFGLQVNAQLHLEFNFGLDHPDTRGGVYVDDTWIWIANHNNDGGLWRAKKCDGSDDGYPNAQGLEGKLWDIYHAGNYIYGVGESKTLFIYDDITGLLAGQKSFSCTKAAFGVYVLGDYAYIASSNSVIYVLLTLWLWYV